MAKTLKELLNGVKKEKTVAGSVGELDQVLGKGEKNFVAKHSTEKVDDRVGNGEDVYNGSKVKVSPYKKQKASVYEEVKKKLTEGSVKFSKHNFFVHKEDGKVHSVHKELDRAKGAANKAEVKSGKTHHITKTSEIEGNPGVHQVHSRLFPDWSKIEKGQKSNWMQVKGGEQDLQYHRLNEEKKKTGPFHVVKLDAKGNPIKGTIISFSTSEAARAYAKANKGRVLHTKTVHEEVVNELSAKLLHRYVTKAEKNIFSQKHSDKKYNERTKGMDRADDKIAKKNVHSWPAFNEEVLDEKWSFMQYPSKDEAEAALSHHQKNNARHNGESRHLGGGKIAFKGEFHGPKPTRLMRPITKEEVEQLDELSPALLGRYAKKAKTSAINHAHQAGQHLAHSDRYKNTLHNVQHYDQHSSHKKDADHHVEKARKRSVGVSKAINKIVDKATPKAAPKSNPKKKTPAKSAPSGAAKAPEQKVAGKPHFKLKMENFNPINEVSADLLRRYINKKGNDKDANVQKAKVKLTKKKFSE